jgi:hypothetical protein
MGARINRSQKQSAAIQTQPQESRILGRGNKPFDLTEPLPHLQLETEATELLREAKQKPIQQSKPRDAGQCPQISDSAGDIAEDNIVSSFTDAPPKGEQ